MPDLTPIDNYAQQLELLASRAIDECISNYEGHEGFMNYFPKFINEGIDEMLIYPDSFAVEDPIGTYIRIVIRKSEAGYFVDEEQQQNVMKILIPAAANLIIDKSFREYADNTIIENYVEDYSGISRDHLINLIALKLREMFDEGQLNQYKDRLVDWFTQMYLSRVKFIIERPVL